MDEEINKHSNTPVDKGPWEKNWEKKRKMGPYKYALLFGILLGTLPFLIILLVNTFNSSFAEVFLDGNFLKNLSAATIGGICGPGFATWHLHEYWYRKSLAAIQKEQKTVIAINNKTKIKDLDALEQETSSSSIKKKKH